MQCLRSEEDVEVCGIDVGVGQNVVVREYSKGAGDSCFASSAFSANDCQFVHFPILYDIGKHAGEQGRVLVDRTGDQLGLRVSFRNAAVIRYFCNDTNGLAGAVVPHISVADVRAVYNDGDGQVERAGDLDGTLEVVQAEGCRLGDQQG